MITRENIRELAQFQGSGPDCAISFYFQPPRPSNKSHREEAILAKDLVRLALRETEKNGRTGNARADLQRVLDLAAGLHGNQTRAKAYVRTIRNKSSATVAKSTPLHESSATSGMV